MSGPITLHLLGDGRLARDLRAHGAPLGRIRLSEASARAILIDLPLAHRHAATEAALRRGQLVLCPPPVARTQAELAALARAALEGSGRLLPAGEIAHSEAGRRGIEAIHAPAFGTMRSLYVAIRQPRGPGDVLADLLPEALDAVLAIVPGDFPSVRVNAGALFGDAHDAAVVLLRSKTGVVVTIEVARCLPPSLPAPGLGEVEIDAMGTRQSVRIVPHAGHVRLYRDDGAMAIPWLNAPVLGMLRALEAADAPETGLARAERALTVMQNIEEAADIH